MQISKHKGFIIGLIIGGIIVSLFIYVAIDSSKYNQCYKNEPPTLFITGSHLKDGTYPNGTWWTTNGIITYNNYYIPLHKTYGFNNYVENIGQYPNGTEYAEIYPWVNTNAPSWCNS